MSLRCWSLLTVAILLLRWPSAAVSQKTCAMEAKTLPLNRTYANCTDLPHLNATLHFTYDPNNSSLSIAFIAAPAPGGAWIAWAINPTSTGMVGSQAIIALKPSDGSAVIAKTFNMPSYFSVIESPLSFDVWGLAADEANGNFRLFCSVKVPTSATSVNQVWQVGGVVIGTEPRIHPMSNGNRQSMGMLELVSSAPSSGSSGGTAPAPDKGDGTRIAGWLGWWSGVVGAIALGLTF